MEYLFRVNKDVLASLQYKKKDIDKEKFDTVQKAIAARSKAVKKGITPYNDPEDDPELTKLLETPIPCSYSIGEIRFYVSGADQLIASLSGGEVKNIADNVNKFSEAKTAIKYKDILEEDL